MRGSSWLRRAFLLGAVAVALLRAQPNDDSHIYVFSEVDRNSSEIAPGSVILVFARYQIGPLAPVTALGFPLVTTLGGTSISVTVNGKTIDAFILAAESEWIRALLPSSTPLGEASFVVTWNGNESLPSYGRIVEHHLGIYDGTYQPPGYLAPTFLVPRVVQNIDSTGSSSLNALLRPARPGQLVGIWGSGLGFAPGDEASGPIPGNITIPGLAVFVGSKPARVVYAGRSGCCAGLDQIIFEVPAGIEGCTVPVWVRYGEEGSGTNDITVSIASGEGACSDPRGLSESEIHLLADGNFRAAQIGLYQSGDPPLGGWSLEFGPVASPQVVPFGSCSHGYWITSPFTSYVPTERFEDAGPVIRIGTPGMTLEAQKNKVGGYYAPFNAPIEPGEYTIEGPGGTQARPFSAEFHVGRQSLTWTNKDDFTSAGMPGGVVVSWNGVDSSDGYVMITGTPSVDGELSWGSFACYEQADTGTFTIPEPILQRAIAGGPANQFTLEVRYKFSKRVIVPGFDTGEFTVTSSVAETKTVSLK